MTTDPAAAQAFYTRVMGWGTAPWGTDGSYTLWMAGEAPVGGCMALPAPLLAAKVPPHWLTYLGTPDIDATIKKAVSLGAKVLAEPQEIPGAGKFAALEDPQGAAFCLYSAATPTPPRSGDPALGEFSWHELMVPDPIAALGFYSAVFGWKKAGEFDMGPEGIYHMFGLGDAPMGGMMKKPDHVPVSNWLPYAKVKSADQAAADIKALGGSILVGPMEVPGGDRIAVAADPLGAVFAVHATKT
ncbi:MAG: VOC family protein [Gemmatimonadetes bacterium]|nr:VOC family protein [Gemmatimonadota bacterium]